MVDFRVLSIGRRAAVHASVSWGQQYISEPWASQRAVALWARQAGTAYGWVLFLGFGSIPVATMASEFPGVDILPIKRIQESLRSWNGVDKLFVMNASQQPQTALTVGNTSNPTAR